jgi:uncharacterized membrane protein YdjX (TVP38/TMEM64 family)
MQTVNSSSKARKRIGCSTWLGAGILACFLAAAVVFQLKLDIGQYVTGKTIATTITTIRAWAAHFGLWGPIMFVLVGAMALIVMTPPFLIIYLSVLLYGYVIGGIAATLALLGGVTLIYFTGQALGRHFVQRLFGARLARIEKRFSRRQLMNVIYFRLVFFQNPWATWLLCLSSVRYRNVLLGTLLGSAHNIILHVWIGGLIVELIQCGRSLNPMKSPQLLIPIVIGLTVLVVVRIVDSVHQRHRTSFSA